MLSLQLPNKPGVYMVTNLINGRFYIGASKYVYQAILNHKSELNCRRSRNKNLQKDWDYYGAEVFAFTTLERCPEALLKEKEEKWLRKAKVEESNVAYNLSYRGYQFGKKK